MMCQEIIILRKSLYEAKRICKTVKEGWMFVAQIRRKPLYIFQSKNRIKQPVPRHNEIDNTLAKHIRKYLGLQ